MRKRSMNTNLKGLVYTGRPMPWLGRLGVNWRSDFSAVSYKRTAPREVLRLMGRWSDGVPANAARRDDHGHGGECDTGRNPARLKELTRADL
jgi:hypothetical protein